MMARKVASGSDKDHAHTGRDRRHVVALFLDMLAAERGAGENTLAAYRRDLADFAAHLRPPAAASTSRNRRPARLLWRALPNAALRRRRWRGGCRRSASSIVFSTRKGNASDDPAAVLEGPKRARALPKIADDRRSRRLLAQARDQTETADQPAGTLRAARLPAWSKSSTPPACAFPNWWRCRPRRPGATPDARGARQGRQGAAGAAQRGRQARHGRISRAAAPKPARRRKSSRIEMAVPLVRRKRPPHAPAFRPRAESAGRGRGIAPATAELRTCCAMPSPAICCTTAPTCAWCRPCSATPTFRPHKSTPTCWRSA